MGNLVYKELKFAIHPFFLFSGFMYGLLMLIPQWIYFLVPLYFCFISVPNIFATYRANNDLVFSSLLPVSRKEIVASRIISFSVIELLHILFALVFAIMNRKIYHHTNFAFDLNPSFFGFVFLLYALFNIILLPGYFRTGYNYGIVTLIAVCAVIAGALAIEMVILFSQNARSLLEGPGIVPWITLVTGILLFFLAGYKSFTRSLSLFDKVDI